MLLIVGGLASLYRAVTIRRSGSGATDTVEVTGTVSAPPRLTSPLESRPCAWWGVRVQIMYMGRPSSALHRSVEVPIDVSSNDVFDLVTLDGKTLTVDPRYSTGTPSAQVVRADQGSLEEPLDIAGVVHRMPATANGRRQIVESVLGVGAPVWISGQLRQVNGRAVLSGAPEQPLAITSTAPEQHRRERNRWTTIRAIMGAAALVLGVVLLVAGP